MRRDGAPQVATAGGLFLVLVVLERIGEAIFIPIIVIALMAAPVVNWRAFFVLRSKYVERDSVGTGLEIESLHLAVNRAFYLAVGSTTLMVISLFIAGRDLGIVGPMDRPTFELLLAYPLLLMTAPAIETLRTVRALERKP